jgi:hypothetical protein
LVAGGKAATLSDAEIAAEWKGQYKVEHCFRLVRVAGKSVRKYTLRRYSFFFKEIEAKSAEFSTPS